MVTDVPTSSRVPSMMIAKKVNFATGYEKFVLVYALEIHVQQESAVQKITSSPVLVLKVIVPLKMV